MKIIMIKTKQILRDHYNIYLQHAGKTLKRKKVKHKNFITKKHLLYGLIVYVMKHTKTKANMPSLTQESG